MTKEEFKELARTYLGIKVEHTNDDRVEIALTCCGDVVDFDFIDYSDVVRVVERLNEDDVH